MRDKYCEVCEPPEGVWLERLGRLDFDGLAEVGPRYWFDEGLEGFGDPFGCTGYEVGRGWGVGSSSMKSRGMWKQQKESSLEGFEGRVKKEPVCGRECFEGRNVLVDKRPSRPVKVSTLVRPSGIGPLAWGAGLEVAWSLCRQQ
jgi:hypothetical protein